ncbi:MAG: HDOD domain-containing protein [Gammaproteobacteria bacterium]|nr:HDOD domain-containing protein [Gammaproteobacteria bacterium]
MTLTPQELVSGSIDLVSLPDVCVRVQAMTEDPDSTAAGLGKVISQDIALTASLLKLVNSAYYGFPVKIDTVSRAVSIVGIRELRDMSLAMSAVEVFSSIPNNLIDMASFWRHSVFCGLVAQALSEHCSILHKERLFIAGLLHDIGKLLIYCRLPEEACEILKRIETVPVDICLEEQRVLGFDHAQVGAELLALWQLPEGLQEIIACHHSPGLADKAKLEAAIVHIANEITNFIEQAEECDPSPYYDPYAVFSDAEKLVGEYKENQFTQVKPIAWEVTGITIKHVMLSVQTASQNFEEVLSLIYPV